MYWPCWLENHRTLLCCQEVNGPLPGLVFFYGWCRHRPSPPPSRGHLFLFPRLIWFACLFFLSCLSLLRSRRCRRRRWYNNIIINIISVCMFPWVLWEGGACVGTSKRVYIRRVLIELRASPNWRRWMRSRRHATAMPTLSSSSSWTITIHCQWACLSLKSLNLVDAHQNLQATRDD